MTEVKNRPVGALLLVVGVVLGVPGAGLIAVVMLYNFVYEAEACHGVYWCDYNWIGLIGLGLVTAGTWLGKRGLTYWTGAE